MSGEEHRVATRNTTEFARVSLRATAWLLNHVADPDGGWLPAARTLVNKAIKVSRGPEELCLATALNAAVVRCERGEGAEWLAQPRT